MAPSRGASCRGEHLLPEAQALSCGQRGFPAQKLALPTSAPGAGPQNSPTQLWTTRDKRDTGKGISLWIWRSPRLLCDQDPKAPLSMTVPYLPTL